MVRKRIGVYLTLKVFLVAIVLVMVGAGVFAYEMYKGVYSPSIFLNKNKEFEYMYIHTNATMADVDSIINNQFKVRYPEALQMVIEKKNFTKVKPGKYRILNGMSNNALINLLRSGNQEEVNYTIKFHRTLAEAVHQASLGIEPKEADIMAAFTDSLLLDSLGMTKENVICLFVPNTYRIYWNTQPKDFVRRLHREYKAFWNDIRSQRARELKMTPEQVVTMASIVDRETKWNDEKPRIAGVYLNRFHRGIKLQADPTIVFASGDFALRRVLNRHLEIPSPYNTYINTGLPPGPICTPSIPSIESVLYPEKHNYLFFCAKTDFSGYHSFASTYEEHNANAKCFRDALNERSIFK